MRIFDSNIELLKRSSPAKLSKRFVCWAIDFVLVALIAGVVFSGLFQITQNTSAYNAAKGTVSDEIAYYEQLTKETHIVEYIDGARVTSDVIVLKNVYRAICLSYEVFGNNQQPDFTFDSTHDVMKNGIHSVENDNIAYFYTQYLKNNPSIDVETSDDLFEIYKKAFGDDATFMFSFNRELSEMPVLNTQVAYYLFHYLFIDSSDSIGQTGATYYRSYHNAYANMLEEAEMLILKSEPYFSTHYKDYKEAYCSEARYTNITLLVSIFIACFVVLIVPKYLFKDEKTLGYKLFGLGVIRVDGEANAWYVPLIKTVISCFGFIPVSFILYLFPPFNGGYEAMFMPVSTDCNVSLAMVILAVIIIGGIINAFSLFTFRRQNLINLIFNDVVVDVHYIDEGERD
ncbi:MAG: hypothetical protein J6S23_00515 [Clostridia bacterium]|nr:hypothetical protein [Clostridia bacterium]